MRTKNPPDFRLPLPTPASPVHEDVFLYVSPPLEWLFTAWNLCIYDKHSQYRQTASMLLSFCGVVVVRQFKGLCSLHPDPSPIGLSTSGKPGSVYMRVQSPKSKCGYECGYMLASGLDALVATLVRYGSACSPCPKHISACIKPWGGRQKKTPR